MATPELGLATSWRRSALRALLAGLPVFVLLFPWGGGVDTYPPTCYGVFGPLWTVPCGGWPAVGAAAFVAGAVLLASAIQPQGIEGRARIALAALGGGVVFVLQFAWGDLSGSDPPTCHGLFDAWTVPCGGWPPVAMGAVAAAAVLVVLSLEELRR